VAIARERHRVQAEDHVERRLVELVSAERTACDAGLDNAAPLALELFALLGREARQEIVERRVALVLPVELAIEPRHQASGLEEGAVID
jgi:hypothetical protein